MHKKVCKENAKKSSRIVPTVAEDYLSNYFPTTLTSIPAGYTQIKVSDLILNVTHTGKYIAGTINSLPRGFEGIIMLSINPENDSCEHLQD